MRYVALLRGINVGGNTMIKMAELKTAFESLGFDRVVTYINSGNLAFDFRKTAEPALVKKIEKAIVDGFGMRVQVMLRTQSAVADILKANPFEGEFESYKEMHVLFMTSEMPGDKQAVLHAQQSENERFAVVGREIYLHLRKGFAESLFGKGFIEKKLKTPVTARNWRTVEKLLEL